MSVTNKRNEKKYIGSRTHKEKHTNCVCTIAAAKSEGDKKEEEEEEKKKISAKIAQRNRFFLLANIK